MHLPNIIVYSPRSTIELFKNLFLLTYFLIYEWCLYGGQELWKTAVGRFVRRTGTVENSGRSVYTEDRNCGKQKCLKFFRKNFEKFRKISKKSKNCFVTEKFYRHKIFINLKILLAKNAPAVFGWKCYHFWPQSQNFFLLIFLLAFSITVFSRKNRKKFLAGNVTTMLPLEKRKNGHF